KELQKKHKQNSQAGKKETKKCKKKTEITLGPSYQVSNTTQTKQQDKELKIHK
ncbi:42716_t:CDS:1, partial [Gigaspora margarita]